MSKKHIAVTFPPGDIVYHAEYARVRQLTNREVPPYHLELQLTSIKDKVDYNVRGEELFGQYISASQFTETENVTQTKLAEILVGAGPLPFTVCFVKANGEERVLTGRLTGVQTNELGRSQVFDFLVKKGSPLRLVDHRSLKWLILDGVEYFNGKKEVL